jgi:hypothetical protein
LPEKRTKILACAVVIEELRSRLPVGIECETMDFGLHRSPAQLRTKLQEAIDRSTEYETIVLAFGLCGMATVGLRSGSSTLVVPRADDCIAIFLGSQEAYLKQQRDNPGSLFSSKGWIEGRIDDTPPATKMFMELVNKYGEARARRMMEIFEARQPLRHYRRMAFITTSGETDLDTYREEARRRAERLHLRYDEIQGSTRFMDKISRACWDSDFVVAPPGRTLTFEDFWSPAESTAPAETR